MEAEKHLWAPALEPNRRQIGVLYLQDREFGWWRRHRLNGELSCRPQSNARDALMLSVKCTMYTMQPAPTRPNECAERTSYTCYFHWNGNGIKSLDGAHLECTLSVALPFTAIGCIVDAHKCMTTNDVSR